MASFCSAWAWTCMAVNVCLEAETALVEKRQRAGEDPVSLASLQLKPSWEELWSWQKTLLTRDGYRLAPFLAGVGENPRSAGLGAASNLSLIFPGDFSHPSTAWLLSLTGLMLMVMWTLPSSPPLSWSPTARQKGMKQPSAHQGAFWTKAETFVACKHDEKEDSEWPDMFELTSTPLTSLSSVVCPRKNLRVAGEPLAPITFHKVFFSGLPGPEHSCLLSFAIVKRLQLCAVYFPRLARNSASFSSVFVS